MRVLWDAREEDAGAGPRDRSYVDSAAAAAGPRHARRRSHFRPQQGTPRVREVRSAPEYSQAIYPIVRRAGTSNELQK